jgi:cobalt-zinc-cadmium efflux system membrane fusion protein
MRTVALMGACSVALALFSGCGKKEKEAEGLPAPVVEGDKVTFKANAPQLNSITTEPAVARAMAVTHVTGHLYWNDEVTVRVFAPVAGRVSSVKADIGDAVSVGGPLAEIDSPDFGQALADARTALGNFAVADKTLAREKELLDHGAAAQKDVEASQAAYAAAIAERDRAQARLTLYGGSDNGTNSLYLLRSPLAGMVVDKNINPGQEIRADMMLANAPNLFAPLFIVSDPTRLWLQLDIPESELTSVRQGLKLRVYAANAFPGKAFDGEIQRIADGMDPSTRTVRVRCEVKNPDRLLKADMYVAADVVRDGTDLGQAGVEVPASALFMKGDDSYLFVEQSAGQYLREKVKVGTEKDNKVPVLDGVSAGQKVVIQGALLLQSIVEPD